MNLETVKNYWNNRPCNIKHSNKPIGTKEYFEEVTQKKYFVEPHIIDFAQHNMWKNKNVLEIGCGIGTDSIQFALHGANLTCIDVSEESLNLAKKRFEVYGLKATFILANAEEIDSILSGKKYDLIYSFGVIHHSPHPEKIISAIKNLSHENTVIKIMVYSAISYKTLESLILHGHKFNFNYKKSIQFYAEAQLGCPIAYTYTKKEIKQLFKNYKIVSLKKDHIFPYVIKDYINKKYNKRWYFKILPKFIFKFLESKLGWHWLIELKIK